MNECSYLSTITTQVVTVYISDVVFDFFFIIINTLLKLIIHELFMTSQSMY